MLRRTRLNRSSTVPPVGTRRSEPQFNDFRKGEITYPPNDVRPKEALSKMVDCRVASIGNYRTRKGCDFYSVPIGETINAQNTSTTGASNQTFNSSTYKAKKITATADGRCTKVTVRLKNDTGATGTVMVSIYSDDSGPDQLLARSSIAQSSIGTSYAYHTARFIAAPEITNTEVYWIVLSVQGGSGSYYISSTTSATTALTSSNQGQTWSSTTYDLNATFLTSTDGGSKGLKRVYKSDGTAYTFLAHGSTLYTISDVDGTTTSVDTGLNASADYCRMEFVNDTLYYVTGLQKPRKYNFSAASEVSTAPANARSVIEHIGLLFYLDAGDLTKFFYTNFADYDVFTSTDFLYGDGPKKSDHLTAFAKLNGVLYIYAKTNKFALYGQDNATFRVDEAIAQKGTFTQESVVWDSNYIYAASDDGIYKFDGSNEENVTIPILDWYTSLTNKDNIALELHDNKLYVWYTPNGEGVNSRCRVYNTALEIWESDDTGAYIGRAFARHDNSNQFYQASNLVGAVYYGELETNDYNNLGDILEYELRTNYDPFGSSQKKKRITKWRPDFQSEAGNYSAQAALVADYSDDATFYDIPLQGTGYTYDSAEALYDTATYASSTPVQITTLPTAGEAYRWQRIYKHHATREPVEFNGETLSIQMRRMT